MEVKIGVQYAPRELVLESAQSPAEIEQTVTDAFAKSEGTLSLTDEKGRRVIVPVGKLAYVEIAEAVTPGGRFHRPLIRPFARQSPRACPGGLPATALAPGRHPSVDPGSPYQGPPTPRGPAVSRRRRHNSPAAPLQRPRRAAPRRPVKVWDTSRIPPPGAPAR